MLSGAARVAGVVGWPVAHSRSPLLHNHWIARHGIDGAYVPLAIPPERLEVALRGLAAAGLAGANVTVPHKEAAARLCDTLTPAAARVAAVNTLIFNDGRIAGDLTDGAAFLASLRAAALDPGGHALVLGAGGAARAIVAALEDAGVRVTLANRTEARARGLAENLGADAVPWADRAAALEDADLLVNATSAGLAGQDELPIALDRVRPSLVVADIVYAPLMTPLLLAARTRGLRAVDGLGMLIEQARPGFAAWFGIMPEADAETRALLEASLLPDSGLSRASP